MDPGSTETGQKSENSEFRDVTTDDKRVWRKCYKCSHKWLGVPQSSVCPKCKKYVRPVKKVVDSEKISGIKVESSKGILPPLPGASAADNDPHPKSKSAVEKEQIEADIPADTYSNIAAFPFEIIANTSKKEYWKLTKKEKDTLAPLLKKVGDKWIGKWFDKYPEEGALALAFGLIITGKFAMEAAHQADMKKQQAATTIIKKQAQGLRENQDSTNRA